MAFVDLPHPLSIDEAAGPPRLLIRRVGISYDRHVGSTPAVHFGVLVRNDGGGTLQAAFFPVAESNRFVSVRPRDVQLRSGASVIVDVKAPQHIVDTANNFFENVTISVISNNAGEAQFSLSLEEWPTLPNGMVNIQAANGVHTWRQTPASNRETASWAWCAAVVMGASSMLIAGVRARVRLERLRALRVARIRSEQAHTAGGGQAPVLDEEEQAVLALVREWEREQAALEWAVAQSQDCKQPPQLAAEKPGAAPEAADALVEVSSARRRTNARPAAVAAQPATLIPDNGWGCDAAPLARPASQPQLPPPEPRAACCAVCLTGARDSAVIPCRHLGLCLACAKQLRSSAAPSCPICRGPFENYITLFVV